MSTDTETEVVETEAAEMNERQLKHYELIQEMERRCELLEQDYEMKNADAKLAKKILETSVDGLRALIRKGPDSQQELPFSDSHLDVPITMAIELTDKQKEKLAEAGVETVADFEKLRAGTPDYPDGLRSIKGVGDALVDKWEEQILTWLSTNQPIEGDEEPDQSLADEVADSFKGIGIMA